MFYSTYCSGLSALKTNLAIFKIEISSDLDGALSNETLWPADIPEHTWISNITMDNTEGDQLVSAAFTVTRYKLNASECNLPRNLIRLCAKASIAELITNRYLKTKTLENYAIDGHFHIIFVKSVLLDEGVNDQRDGFDKIPEKDGTANLLSDIQITFEDIYSVLDKTVLELITPPDWSREQIVEDVAQDFGVSEDMLSHSIHA